MMYYLDSKGVYVNDIEDLRDIVTDDIYEAMEGMHNDEIKQLKDECDTGDELLEEYESRSDECKSNLYEAQELCKQLLDMVDSSKRLNRDKLRDLIIDTWRTIDIGIDS